MGVQALQEGKFDHLMLDWRRDNLAAASYLVDCCRTGHGILALSMFSARLSHGLSSCQ